jgi:crossover junction endodeoxyribonuclease RuvC
MGIDPGTATTGYGVVEKSQGCVKYLTAGVILTPSSSDAPVRLNMIYAELNRLLDLYQPDVLVSENLFFGKNVTSAIHVGRTLGVVLLATAQRGIPWTEYRPAEVKVAVTGYGAAEKRQVQLMVQRLLSLDKMPKPDDAADALAIAICHAESSKINALGARAAR